MALNKKKICLSVRSRLKTKEFTFKKHLLGKVPRYNYFGYERNKQWDGSLEIKRQIEIARSAFNKMKTILCNGKLGIGVRARVLRCYIFSDLLQRVEESERRHGHTL